MPNQVNGVIEHCGHGEVGNNPERSCQQIQIHHISLRDPSNLRQQVRSQQTQDAVLVLG